MKHCEDNENIIPKKKRKPLSQSNTLNNEENLLDEDDKNFFKDCAAIQQEDIIKLKLEKTLEVRKSLFLKSINVFEHFPFFFFNPKLVSSYIFETVFPYHAFKLFFLRFCSIFHCDTKRNQMLFYKIGINMQQFLNKF